MTEELNQLASALSTDSEVTALIELALAEDLGTGDITTHLMVPEEAVATARLIAREGGVFAGTPILSRIAELSGFDLQIHSAVAEGETVEAGEEVLTIQGRARGILSLERIMLNVLQRLSGIATMTRVYTNEVSDHECTILETRKTVPGWRKLDKYAVLAGGGANHRMGLFDQVLAKENHFALAGVDCNGDGFGEAVQRLVQDAGDAMIVEVEVEDLSQFRAALAAGAHIIMLDNMALEDMTLAVQECREAGDPRPLLEASGGITIQALKDVAATGVDRISVGALTHSVKALDISLLVDF